MVRGVVAVAVVLAGSMACGSADGPGGLEPGAQVPWSLADCDVDPAGTGWAEGDILPDFSLINQHGVQTSLHDFCDRHVLIQVTNFW